jgi:hypothetical protein
MRWSVVTIFVVIAASAAYLSAAPDGNSLQEALTAKFNVGPAGPVDNPPLDPTNLLIVRRPEIVAVPYGSGAIPESRWNYKDGSLHAPGFGSRLGSSLLGNQMTGQLPRQLAVGEKAYLVRWELNLKADKISFILFQCDGCNGLAEPSMYRAGVVFQFPKTYLATADASQVEGIIGNVLTVLHSAPARAQLPPAGSPQGLETQVPTAQESVNIQLGQTPDQVISMLGQPERKAAVGPKEIYFYKDMKITFQNGTVWDVQ